MCIGLKLFGAPFTWVLEGPGARTPSLTRPWLHYVHRSRAARFGNRIGIVRCSTLFWFNLHGNGAQHQRHDRRTMGTFAFNYRWNIPDKRPSDIKLKLRCCNLFPINRTCTVTVYSTRKADDAGLPNDFIAFHPYASRFGKSRPPGFCSHVSTTSGRTVQFVCFFFV
jgi:hypothetical protein